MTICFLSFEPQKDDTIPSTASKCLALPKVIVFGGWKWPRRLLQATTCSSEVGNRGAVSGKRRRAFQLLVVVIYFLNCRRESGEEGGHSCRGWFWWHMNKTKPLWTHLSNVQLIKTLNILVYYIYTDKGAPISPLQLNIWKTHSKTSEKTLCGCQTPK